MLSHAGSKSVVACVLFGGAAFWIPDVVISAGKKLNVVEAVGPIVQTILLPAVLVAVYYVVRRRSQAAVVIAPIALLMLVGVWGLGSLFMAVGGSFTGGSFFSSRETAAFLLTFGILPPVTFMMSTYDGSLFALLLATFVMPLLHLAYERRCWRLPASMSRYLSAHRT